MNLLKFPRRYNTKGQSLLEFALWGSLALIAGGVMISYALYYIHQQDIMYRTFREAVKLAKRDNVAGSGQIAYAITVEDKRFPTFMSKVPVTSVRRFVYQSSALWSINVMWDDGQPAYTYTVINVNGKNIAQDIVGRPYFRIDMDTVEDNLASIADKISAVAAEISQKEDLTSEEAQASKQLLGLAKDIYDSIDKNSGSIGLQEVKRLKSELNRVLGTYVGRHTVQGIVNTNTEWAKSFQDISDSINYLITKINNGDMGLRGDFSFIRGQGLSQNRILKEEGTRKYEADSNGNLQYQDTDTTIERTLVTNNGEYKIKSRINGDKISFGGEK